MKQYQEICKKALVGTKKSNRTGIDHIGYHGDMMKFDLRDGFPLVTTKQMAWRTCFAEMLGFLRGYDNASQFRSLGCKIWDQNANENQQWFLNPNRKGEDDLGRIYGVRWRKWRNWQERKSLDVLPSISGIPELPIIYKKQEIDLTQNKSGFVGKIFQTQSDEPYVVYKEYRPEIGKHLLFNIQFLKTLYIKEGVQKSQLCHGFIKDPYAPNICNVACRGMVEKKDVDKLYETWHDMIHRCYGKNRDNNKWYKDCGIKVSDKWLVFENFVNDYKKIPRWELKECFPHEFSLDKDITLANVYDVTTCRWASKIEQAVNSKQCQSFIGISPDGKEYCGRGSKVFAQEHGLSADMVKHCVNGTCKTHKGWTFKPSQIEFYYTEEDQLKLVVAKLLLRRDDRRLIITGWHPTELDQQALPCCHVLLQFGIEGEYLNLSMYQRSCDLPLGVPFNIAGYAWLLSVISHITGLKPGIFTHFMHDIHIYENQIAMMKEQLRRIPYELPKLCINPDIRTLKDLETWVTTDDFEIYSYRHHEKINYPFAV